MLGSGKPDFGAGVAADYRAFDRLMLYFNRNLVYPVGPITDGDLTLNPMVTESFAVHLGLTRRWSVDAAPGHLHQPVPRHRRTQCSTARSSSSGSASSFAYNPWVGAQLLGIQNMSGVEQSADFTRCSQPGLPAVGEAERSAADRRGAAGSAAADRRAAAAGTATESAAPSPRPTTNR